MMKLKRLVASMLALLLAVSLLPMTAMAVDVNPENTTVAEVANGETMNTNNGQVGTYQEVTDPVTNETTQVADANKGNFGTIGTNNGTVTINQNGGTVEINEAGGIIEKNSGYVGDWRYGVDNFQTNSGNKGTVQDNLANGKVNNLKGGTVTNNGGTVYNDGGGTVVDNNAGGEVVNNGGTVVDNNAGGEVDNNEGGEVGTNNAGGTVTNKGGTVVSNSGEVNNNNGVVEVNEVGGHVANNSLGPDAAGAKVETNFGTVDYGGDPTKTYYGVHYVVDGEKVYLGQFEKSNTVTISDLDISRSGYKLVKCEKVEGYNNNDFDDWTDQTVVVGGVTTTVATRNEDGSVSGFFILAPTRLKLVWEKIASVFKPAASSGGDGGAEAVKLSAGKRYIGLGSVIFINEKGYKVVELKDDAYVVVSFDALPDEDVKDLDALFAKLFTAEQQKLIKNIGQLLDAEDVLAVFGKSGNHPVFEVNKTLVE